MKKLSLLITLILLTVSFQACDSDEPCTQMAKALREGRRVAPTTTSFPPNDEVNEFCRDSEEGLVFDNGAIVEIDCECPLPFRYERENGESWLFLDPSTEF